MSLFVEVDSVEKKCPVIINLDNVLEIAPLIAGGCTIFFADAASVNGKHAMKVTNPYEDFKQFVLQRVTAEDIAKTIDRITPVAKDAKPKQPPVKQKSFAEITNTLEQSKL
jgi:hypothetical protein